MDAGTAAATSNGRLRAQLLAADTYAEQGPAYGNEYRKAPSLRKASLTSQSAMSMNRFFRRKGPGDGNFNDDAGADVLDFTAGANVSFDDIAHLRDHGPYVTGMGRQDTAPIIPTLGAGSSALGSGRTVNNVQYRKQMNQQKKMAMASGARAMSMGGQNPMNPQGDPRAMSMGGFNPMNDPRSMSLMSGNPMADPRSMSLMNSGPDPRMGPYGQHPGAQPNGNYNGRAMSMGGARAMSMGQRGPGPYQNQNQYGPYGQPQPGQGQPGYGYQPMQGPMQPMQPMPMQGYGPRGPYRPNGQAMSLTNSGHISPNRFPPNANAQMSNQMQPNQMNQMPPHQNQMQGQRPPNPTGVPPQTLYSRNLIGANGETYQRVAQSDSQVDISQSSDSLMKVEEEEAGSQEEEHDDVVYRFNEEDETVSRKSTIQKSNSMRLRKLDLFSQNKQPSQLRDEEDNDEPVDIDNASFESRSFESTEGDITVGGRAADDEDIVDPNMPSPTVGRTPQKSETPHLDAEDGLQSPTRMKDLPSVPDGQRRLPSKPSIRLLVTNTAYQNFRPPVNDSSLTLGSSNYSDMDTPEEEVASKFNSNNHAEDDQAKNGRWSEHETAPTTASTSHGSRRSDDKHQYRVPDKEVYGPERNLTQAVGRPPQEMATGSPREAPESRRSSRTFSITSNIFKRLSKSGKRSNSVSSSKQAVEDPAIPPRRRPSNALPTGPTPAPEGRGVKFTKEELGIMQENGSLLNELEAVSTELASSIRREVALEYRLQGREATHPEGDVLHELTRKLQIISDLQEKLNKERRLRFISEEHALFLENGISPSPLKLNYEKTELYKQLLIKNDMVNQLQDKLAEYQDKDDNLLLYEKYHELVKEHTELKYNVVPELERRAKGGRVTADKSLVLAPEEQERVYSQALEIARLQSQREDLREVVGKMQQEHKIAMNHANEKVKKLEAKLKDIAHINERLTSRMELNSVVGLNNSSQQNLLGGGRLQGLSIVSPNKSLFDE